MKILQCHNMYQLPGGEDAAVKDEYELLTANGHRVVQYLRHNDEIKRKRRIGLAANTIWNRSAAREIEAMIAQEKPEVVHIHNTMPLISPSVYDAAKRAGAPIVQSLHNYRLLCPKGTFFRDGEMCEACLGKTVKWPAIRYACYRDSRAGSAVLTVMSAVHHWKGTYNRHVDAFIACSHFARDKMIEGGLPGERIFVKPNFVMSDPGIGSGEGGYMLYLGRLSAEKGIATLLLAWEKLEQKVPLWIVGEGPLEDQVKAMAQRHTHVRYLGWVGFPELNDVIKQAACLILPSVNFEGFPKVIVEAYANGLPIIASRIGSLDESVQDGVTGCHFEMNNAADLAEVVHRLMDSPELLGKMRINARAAYEENYTAEKNYEALMDIYQKAIGVAERC